MKSVRVVGGKPTDEECDRNVSAETFCEALSNQLALRQFDYSLDEHDGMAILTAHQAVNSTSVLAGKRSMAEVQESMSRPISVRTSPASKL
jgi:hypothetical protein